MAKGLRFRVEDLESMAKGLRFRIGAWGLETEAACRKATRLPLFEGCTGSFLC